LAEVDKIKKELLESTNSLKALNANKTLSDKVKELENAHVKCGLERLTLSTKVAELIAKEKRLKTRLRNLNKA